MPEQPSCVDGRLHHYAPRLVAFEHSKPSTSESPNTLIWVGGLGDGLLTVSYPTALAQSLPCEWSLSQVLLSSSYDGWGTSSLPQDCTELAECISYFQSIRPGKKIVLMGHSTGCQDALFYLTGRGFATRPSIQGVVLQASVSDREGMQGLVPKDVLDSGINIAQDMSAAGKEDEVLPSSATPDFTTSPVTAKRWLSLLSPSKDGDDDLFSSDLTNEQLKKSFGSLKRGSPLLILFSGSDQFAPDWVDKKAMVKRWTGFVRDGGGSIDEENGGIVDGASHNLQGDPDGVVQDLLRRVNGFIGRLDTGDFTKGL
ncbi:DUF1749-domain-containing protein [Aulographum hederae CBS 113979]|uniref:DUF1749-domain-containing protein n=1 Tax=Aulographum hederae CBS 113979 TaxID=1176131 RepID=A0A6G1H122_9PEZI|nr:DUF1749-domain-containing protein [Aulographum hederae CBS 113979]